MAFIAEELRDQVWSFNELWGEERVAVRKFLKDEWKKNNKTEQVATNYVDAKNEADSILEWWWQEKYCSLYKINSDEFGQWLYQQYRDFLKVNPIDNVVPEPRQY